MRRQLLILVVWLITLPVAAQRFFLNDIFFRVLDSKNKTCEVYTNVSAFGKVEIPSFAEYNGENYKVTSIADSAFYNSKITYISIPSSVTSIGRSAFGECDSLRNAEFESIESICKINFENETSNPLCRGALLIDGIKITDLIIPNTISSIGDYAFYNSGLKSVTIPASVTSIGVDAFEGFHLESVKFASIKSLCSIKFKSIQSNPISSSQTFFIGNREITDIVVPNSVASIGNYTFALCSKIRSIYLPESIVSIGDSAFYRCDSLISISIPKSVKSIGSEAFKYCYNIRHVEFASIKSICSIEFKDFYSNPAYYPNRFFIGGKEITKVIIPQSLSSIGSYAFAGCHRIRKLVIPQSIKSIGEGAFYCCDSVVSITLPNTLTSIANYTFAGCGSLKTINIPESVTSIGDYAFLDCKSLTTIVLPESVKSIGDEAFFDCASLDSINIPDSVESIGIEAFEGCKIQPLRYKNQQVSEAMPPNNHEEQPSVDKDSSLNNNSGNKVIDIVIQAAFLLILIIVGFIVYKGDA